MATSTGQLVAGNAAGSSRSGREATRRHHPAAGTEGAGTRGSTPVPLVTPASNTGVTVQGFRVHWWAGTVAKPVPDVLDTLTRCFDGVVFEQLRHGGYGYEASAIGPGGARVYWSPAREDVFVSFPGDACDALGLEGIVQVADGLGMAPTSRMDLAWDVQGITPVELHDWHQAGDVVTRAHRDSWGWHQNSEGSTWTLGKRSSERFLRCYDRRGDTRLELELKGARSTLVWAQLRLLPLEDWSEVALGHLRAYVDFRDRGVSDRPEDCPLLPSWESFCGGAVRQRLLIPRKRPSLDRTLRWMDRMAASVAMVADAGGHPGRYLAGLYKLGRANRRPRHRAMLAVAARGTS